MREGHHRYIYIYIYIHMWTNDSSNQCCREVWAAVLKKIRLLKKDKYQRIQVINMFQFIISLPCCSNHIKATDPATEQRYLLLLPILGSIKHSRLFSGLTLTFLLVEQLVSGVRSLTDLSNLLSDVSLPSSHGHFSTEESKLVPVGQFLRILPPQLLGNHKYQSLTLTEFCLE